MGICGEDNQEESLLHGQESGHDLWLMYGNPCKNGNSLASHNGRVTRPIGYQLSDYI